MQRIVVDTNAVISRLLLPRSVPGRAVHKVIGTGRLLVSDATLGELAGVLARTKFAAYVTIQDRQQFLRLLGRVAVLVPITHAIRACRDPQDDKFLELAVNGGASVIITGDKDLLAMADRYPIVTPAKFWVTHAGL